MLGRSPTSAPRPRRRGSVTQRKDSLPPFPVQQMFVLGKYLNLTLGLG